MRSRKEYQPVRASLMNRALVPTLDVSPQELLCEEQMCHWQTLLEEHKNLSFSSTSANLDSLICSK